MRQPGGARVPETLPEPPFEILEQTGWSRRPDGGALGPWRAGVVDGMLWLLPSRMTPQAFAEGSAIWREAMLPLPGGSAGAYWLAHALRQDVWRAYRGLPGALPMVAVSAEPLPATNPGTGLAARRVLLGMFSPGRGQLPGERLSAVLENQGLARHLTWAARKAGSGVRPSRAARPGGTPA
ncbi:MAG: hypothetical protein AAF675_12345 [Pseudomonadota bacterium]